MFPQNRSQVVMMQFSSLALVLLLWTSEGQSQVVMSKVRIVWMTSRSLFSCARNCATQTTPTLALAALAWQYNIHVGHVGGVGGVATGTTIDIMAPPALPAQPVQLVQAPPPALPAQLVQLVQAPLPALQALPAQAP